MEIKIKTLDESRDSHVRVVVAYSSKAGERITYLSRNNASVSIDAEVSASVAKGLDAMAPTPVRAVGEAWRDGYREGFDASSKDRTYTAEEVGRFQTSEAELVAAPLRVKIKELERLAEDRLSRHNQDVTEYQNRMLNLNKEIARLRNRMAGNAGTIETLFQRTQEAERDRDTFKAQAYEQNDRAAKEKKRADDNRGWAERTQEELKRRTKERDDCEAARSTLKGDLQRVRDLAGDDATVVMTRSDLTRRLLDIRDLFQA